MKKSLVITFAAALCTFLSWGGSSWEDEDGRSWVFGYDDEMNGVRLDSVYPDLEGEVVIPERLDGSPIVRFEEGFFSKFIINATTLVLPGGLDYRALCHYDDGDGGTITPAGVFADNLALRSISVAGSGGAFATADGLLYSGDFKTLYFCPRGRTGTVRVHPFTRRIAMRAFSGCAADEIVLGQHVEYLGSHAFEGCTKLKKLSVPVQVCDSGLDVVLKDVSGPITLGITGRGAIQYNALEGVNCIGSVDIGPEITSIGSEAFKNCSKLETFTGGGSLTLVNYDFAEGTPWSSLHSGGQNTVVAGCLVDVAVGYDAQGGMVFNIPAEAETVDWNLIYKFNSGSYSLSVAAGSRLMVKDGVLFSGDMTKLLWMPSCRTGSYAVPSTVTEIGAGAFIQSRLSSVTLPSGLRRIGDVAFEFSSLTSLAVPDAVRHIGDAAIYGMPVLEKVTIGTGIENEPMLLCDGLPELGEAVITGGGTVPPGAFRDCDKLEKVTIGSGVRGIGRNAFSGCDNLDTVTGGGALEWAGENVFADTMWLTRASDPGHDDFVVLGNLLLAVNSTSADILYVPEAVTRVNGDVFGECYKLQNLMLPKDFAEPDFGYNHLKNCYDLRSIYVAEGGTSIYSSYSGMLFDRARTVALYCPRRNEGMALKMTLPSTVLRVGDRAFCDNGCVKEIDLGGNVTEVGDEAFYDSYELTVLSGADKLTASGSWAFQNTDLCNREINEYSPFELIRVGTIVIGYAASDKAPSALVIPSDVTEIADYALSGLKIGSVTLPPSLRRIGGWAFSGCTGLSEVSGGDNVEDIGEGVFYGTPWLEEQVEGAEYSRYDREVMLGKTLVRYVRARYSDGRYAVPAGTVTIGGGAFRGQRLESLTLPSSLRRIGDRAFYEGTITATLRIPDSVEEIGESAFDAAGFSRIVVGRGIRKIGEEVFGGVERTWLDDLGDLVFLGGLVPELPKEYGFALPRFYIPAGSADWAKAVGRGTLGEVKPRYHEGAYAVAFDGAGGTGAMPAMECGAGRVYQLTAMSYAAPAGRTFLGWKGGNGKLYMDGLLIFDLVEPFETLVLTAAWK